MLSSDHTSLIKCHTEHYTSLFWTPLGLQNLKVSSIKRCPYFRGIFIHIYGNRDSSQCPLYRRFPYFRDVHSEWFHCNFYPITFGSCYLTTESLTSKYLPPKRAMVATGWRGNGGPLDHESRGPMQLAPLNYT